MTSSPPTSPAFPPLPPRTGVFRALRHRNYRLFFAGQTVSLVGTWITRVATAWLVYRLTGSVLLLGVVSFCGQIPTLVLAPVAGVLVDRWNRHRILLVTQVLSMVQSFALAGLSFAGIIKVRDVLLLQIAQGIINAFDTPARQSFVVEMVEDRADLPNAIALNSSMVNLSRVIGPSIGGVIIAAVGEAWCFTIDGGVVHRRHRIAAGDACVAAPTSGADDEDLGRARGRIPLRHALAADSLRAAPARAREHDGYALHRAHARGRAERAARRLAHARLSR